MQALLGADCAVKRGVCGGTGCYGTLEPVRFVPTLQLPVLIWRNADVIPRLARD